MYTPSQQLAIEIRNTNICINANAGAGKTTVLIERIVSLLKENIPLTEILAITFTEKAAQEISDRLREALQKNNIPGDIDTAWISTIHGFCARVLRERWFVLGLSPHFGILGEAQSTILLEKAIQRAIQLRLNSDDTGIIQVLSVYKEKHFIEHTANLIKQIMAGGISVEHCNKLAQQTIADSWQAFVQTRETYLQEVTLQLKTTIQSLAGKGSAKKTEEVRLKLMHCKADTASEFIQNVANTIEGFRASKAPQGIDELDHADITNTIKEIRDTIKSLQPLVGDYTTQDEQDLALTHAILQITAEAYTTYQNLKTELNALDYEDLQLKTLELFQDKHMQDIYKNKFATIMLDEFQDTNPLQNKLFSQIVRSDNLCLVGDWKQSIYLFRNADVSIFRNYIQEFQTKNTGKVIPLQENFRSSPAILSFVNEACVPVFQPLSYEPLIADPSKTERGLPVQCIQLPFTEDERAEQVREKEATALANAIQQSHTQGIAYADMAILLRTLSNLDIYERTLKRAHIPYMVVGGRGYYQTPEIQDILQYLTILQNPHNDLALAAVLRSDLVGIADPTLVILRAAAKEVLFMGIDSQYWGDLPIPEQQRLKNFKKTFEELRHCIDKVSLPTLLSLVYEKTAYTTLVLAYPKDGQRMLGNLNKLQEIALQAKASTLEDFIHLIEELVLKETREEEAPLLATTDVLRIMTIHKSKGMQFKAVFLPGLHQFATLATREVLLFNHTDTAKQALPIGIQYNLIPGDSDTAKKSKVYQLLKMKRDNEEQAESKRLFYVATTRAKDQLWLIHSYPENKEYTSNTLRTENWGAWLSYLLQDQHIRSIEYVTPPEFIPIDQAPEKIWSLPDHISWEHFKTTHTENDLSKLTILEASTLLVNPNEYFKHMYLGVPKKPTETQHFSTAHAGNIVHSIIENNTKNFLETVSKELVTKQEQALILQCCTNYFSSTIYKELCAATNQHHELSFNYTLEGLHLVGRVDLAYEYNGIWTIIDFKTNQPEPIYEYQIALYREILAKALDILPETIKAYVYYLPEDKLLKPTVKITFEAISTQIKKSGILVPHG